MRTSTIRLVGRKLAKFSFPRPTSVPSSNVITNHLPHASRELPKLTSVESTEERRSRRVCPRRRVERIRAEERKKEAAATSRAPSSLLLFSSASSLENCVGNEKADRTRRGIEEMKS